MSSIYVPDNPGTVSFANGSTAIVGAGTLFRGMSAGGLISIPGLGEMQLAEDPTSDTEAVGVVEWQGADTGPRPYQHVPRNAQATFSQKLAQLVSVLAGGNIQSLAELEIAANSLIKGAGAGALESVDGTNVFALAELEIAANSLIKGAGPGVLESVDGTNVFALAELEIAARKILATDASGDLIQADLTDKGQAILAAEDNASVMAELGVTPFWNTRLGADVDAASARTGLGVVAYEPQSLSAAQQGQARANIGADILDGARNAIINGNGNVITRIVPSTMAPVGVTNDAYGHDQHYALCSGAGVEYSTIYAPTSGVESMMRLQQTQASAQRFGYAQPIEAIRTYRMRGKTVTLGGKLRCSSAQPIRFAVLEWTGAADTLTSNVVNNWASTSYTAGSFFIGAPLVVRAVGSITPVANAITDWSLLATIGSAANNLIAFYWTEGTAAQNVTLDQRWYLVEGDATAEAEPFPAVDVALERKRCERFWWRGLPAASLNFNGYATSAYTSWPVVFPTTMIFVPSVATALPGITLAGNAETPSVGAPTRNGCRILSRVLAANVNANFSFGVDDYIEARAQL